MSEATCIKTIELRDLLLKYLQARVVFAWPGGDGLTLDDVLNCYPQAIADGKVPDWRALGRQHPDLTAELQGFLAAKGWPERSAPS